MLLLKYLFRYNLSLIKLHVLFPILVYYTIYLYIIFIYIIYKNIYKKLFIIIYVIIRT